MKKCYGLLNEWCMKVYFCLWEMAMERCVGGINFSEFTDFYLG